MIFYLGGHSSHVMVQSESNVPSTLPSFILEQAKRFVNLLFLVKLIKQLNNRL